jgi:histone H3/H4
MPSRKRSDAAAAATAAPEPPAEQQPRAAAPPALPGEAMANSAAESPSPPEAGGADLGAGSKQIVSKAAIRRLAHDVGARLGKDAHAAALQELQGYVAKVLRLAANAMAFSRHRSIALNHVLFAAGVCGGVPASLRQLPPEELRRLNKSNPQAPPALRKDVLWRAEISEASFAKVTKSIAKQCEVSLRITSQARRMLQLLAEYQLMRSFDRRGTLAKPEEEVPMVQDMANVFECDQATAQQIVALSQEVCGRTPELLALGAVKTIDERLIRAALLPSRGWALDWRPPEAFVSAKIAKVVERILRGRAADKRVTISASGFLAAALMRVVLESRGLPVPSAQAPPPPPRAAASARGKPKAKAKAEAGAEARATKPAKTIGKPRAKAQPAARVAPEPAPLTGAP